MKLLDEYGIKQDERFKRANKEAWVVFIYWVIYAAWCYIPALIADKVPVEEYHYVAGMPLWYLISLTGYAGFVIVAGIAIACWIKDCKLTPTGKEDD